MQAPQLRHGRIGAIIRPWTRPHDQENADAAADVFSNAGFDVSTATVDISSRQSIQTVVETATKVGDVTGLIQAAGVSPSQASPETILAVDL